MKFSQYDVVRLTSLRAPLPGKDDEFNLRSPIVGDVATIVEIYSDPPGYELECSDVNGITQWLIALRPDDIKLELTQ